MFSTIDYIFHFYGYIHLCIGREGEECSSCRNGWRIVCPVLLLLILKYIMDEVYSTLWPKDRFLKEKSTVFRKIKMLSLAKHQISKYFFITKKILSFCFHPPIRVWIPSVISPVLSRTNKAAGHSDGP